MLANWYSFKAKTPIDSQLGEACCQLFGCVVLKIIIPPLNMRNMNKELMIAVYGWSHSSWNSEFYPDDLPEDWRLSFYSNEFRAVVVPSSVWSGFSSVEVERWVEDAFGEFVFYLEVDDLLVDWEHIAEIMKPLGSQLGGIILRPKEVDADLGLIAGSLASSVSLAPVSLLLPDGAGLSPVGERLLKESGVELCWSIDEKLPRKEPCWYGKGLAVARFSGNLNYTPRLWRETIETCLRCGAVNDSVLMMVENDSPDIESLRVAVVISDMMNISNAV